MLHSDKGLTGLGEATHALGFTRASAEDDARIADAVRRTFVTVDGESPFDLEQYRQRAWEPAKAGGLLMATAYSAIEQAMCDLCGQALGVPLHELLGGRVRDSVPVYANINRSANRRTPEDFAEKAQMAVSEGFRAVKAAVFDDFPAASTDAAEREAKVELGVRRLEAMREAVGPAIDIMVDCHSRFDRALSIRVAKMLEPVKLRWYEEPVDPNDLVDTRAIRDSIAQPMAGGEILFGREGFLPLLQSQAVDVIMPDVKHCGGVFEGKKIAALAETFGVGFSPHNPSGPVSMAASAQLASTVPNCPVLEHAWGEVDWRAEVLDPPERFENGAIVLSGRPGIGHKLAR
ncbi:MAG: mandelate racemase/muconate lactonizing enzyme family protein [Bryobacterales bacterium]|nr:mandelate racemase/muconate lactonizing enzyme family protein [Bryobacterales bacterium]